MEIIIDSREKRPLEFPDTVLTSPGTLYTGDYSVKGLTEPGPLGVVVERKSLDDLVGCCKEPNRERFEKELGRMKAYGSSVVIVEASLEDVIEHRYRSRMHPNAVRGSVWTWIARGSHFHWAGTRMQAAKDTAWFLKNAYNDRIRMWQGLKKSS